MFIINAFKMFVDYFSEFMKALGITISLSLFGVLLAIILGTIICLLNLSKNKIAKGISTAYIEIIRGIPLLLQLTVIYIAMPRGISTYLSCLLAIVLNSAAYVAEIIRAGINAVDIGQTEAGRSLGLNNKQTMFKIVLPQAIKNILPALGNEFVMLIKETSLASTFFVGDLMTIKKIITSTTYDALTPYFIVAVIYFCLTFSLSKLIKKFERKLNA